MHKFSVGGSLALDDPTYIERSADTVLYEALCRGDFCHVLTSRQMGKSSLRLRTRHRIEAAHQGRCASIDITRLGSEHVLLPQWYQGLAFELSRQFQLPSSFNLQQWWIDQGNLSPVQILGQFLEKILLELYPDETLFIFLDEIDSVRGLDFSVDDFFALIRYCYNQRAENPAYNRLTWALFGVAKPSDLIADPRRTPFNIGRAIELPGFTIEEANPLIPGLAKSVQNPHAILTEILRWTGGQPFLTQKLCSLVQQSSNNSVSEPLTIPPGTESFWVDNLVNEKIVHHWENHDEPEHLKTICDRILADDRQSGQLLSLYQTLLEAEDAGIRAEGSPEQTELQLAGIALDNQGTLRVANHVYAAVFDHTWVQQQLAHQRPYANALKAWEYSEYLDESRLLMGQALEESLEWATDKNLTEVDYRFLSASQELDARLIRIALETQEEATLLLAAAQQKARRIIRWSYLSLATCLGISAVSLLVSLIR